MIDPATIITDDVPHGLELALELATLQRPTWAAISDRIPSWHPRLEGEDDADDDDDPAKKKKAPTADADDEDEDDDDTADLEAARKAAAAANRELKRFKAERAKEAETTKRKAGEFQALYEETKAELDKLKADVTTTAKSALVIAALTKAKAVNPAKAVRLLDLDDIDDAADAERAVKRLAKDDKYLFENAAPTRQKRGAGGSDDDTDDPSDRKRTPGVSRLRRGLEATSTT